MAKSYPTVAELAPFLGTKWAICRNTPKNIIRYGRCLTKSEFKTAQAKAIAAGQRAKHSL